MFLETLPGLQVTIRCDGQQLAEFDDEDHFPGPVERCKYVEATPGSNFAIHVNSFPSLARAPKDRLRVRVSLDGKRVTAKVTGIGSTQDTVINGKKRNTYRGHVLQRLQFAHLQTTDGPLGKLKPEDFKELGTVKVDIRLVHEIPVTYAPAETRWESAVGASIAEKCLKGRAISSHATMGAPELHGSRVHYVDVVYPYGDKPLAVFTFKYRSRADLQVEGVIPRSPTPVPLEDRDPDSLSAEEARELVRLMRRREDDQNKIKRENIKREGSKRARSTTLDGDSDSEGVTVTGEGSSRKRSRPSNDSAVEVIDLTDD